jgi:RimJ/RimL family protein N-acetyltransferase
MELHPIDIDETRNEWFRSNPECIPILEVFVPFYGKVGFEKPWIAYFVSLDGKELVGGCGFKGKPKEGKVEISYGTFKAYEGKGIGKEICRQMILIAQKTDPSVRITARTIEPDNASTSILKHNGFECTGKVYDEEDGDVWEWELKKSN